MDIHKLRVFASVFRNGAVWDGKLGHTSIVRYSGGITARDEADYPVEKTKKWAVRRAGAAPRREYPAEAATLEPTECLLVPAEEFRRLFAECETLRDDVFGLFADRLSLTMELVGEVAFGSLERRLEDYLVERAENDRLRLTHQAIANDLGSSREVVSRLLR